jgi:hypothetical protein
VAIEVSRTATAREQLKALRGRRAAAARTAIEEIVTRGCDDAGCRLTERATASAPPWSP